MTTDRLTKKRPIKVLFMKFVQKQAIFGTSSSVSLRSKRQTISKASEVLQDKEGTRNSPRWERERDDRSAIVSSCRTDLFKSRLTVVEHAATR